MFKEYVNTQDSELAKCLASNAKVLCASDEDVINLVKANGLEVIGSLTTDIDSEDVINAVVDRAKKSSQQTRVISKMRSLWEV